MKFVDLEFNTTLEIKKSKFITHLCPYNKFDEVMERLKKEHPKARHFVYAYRYLNEFEQVVENSSDDGEPKGTSGRPSLSVLSGACFINTAVIIVRYFGGVRLGTGGLVRAYSEAVNLSIQNATSKEFVKQETKKFTVTYSQFSQIEYLLDKYNIHIKNKEFQDTIVLFLEGTSSSFIEFSKELFLDNILEDIEV